MKCQMITLITVVHSFQLKILSTAESNVTSSKSFGPKNSLRSNDLVISEAEKYWLEHYVEEPRCTFHSAWTINCYSCTCDTGKPSCKLINGCKPPLNNVPGLCKPYSKFSADDNKCSDCVCNGDGYPECKFHRCAITSSLARSLYRPIMGPSLRSGCPKTRMCKPKSAWVSNCYKCKCDVEGQPQCRRMEGECTPRPYGVPASCKPYTPIEPVEPDPCVQCKCTDDGEMRCARLKHPGCL